MTYVFDIDGTICTVSDGQYSTAKPLQSRINKVNTLYDEGHEIIFQTARGMGRSDNSESFAYAKFYEFTKQQLKDWGVRYHSLFLGKPSGDIYVDDKGINDEDFFNARD
tara:strand:+ start:18701 stop:19027 length:327 start_codon:yes stop_codon:yes gene_type:complete